MTTPTRAVRVPDDLWNDVQLLTADTDETATSIMVDALRIYVEDRRHDLANARRRDTRRRKARGYCTEACQGVGVLHPYHGVGDLPTVLRPAD
jgi:predicted transcriptional regulator